MSDREDMAARPETMPEREANSAVSHDEGDLEGDAEAGSSADEEEAPSNTTTTNNNNNDDASEETPRKRKRVKYQKTSCELCKARKVKCDRAEPACSWCARHNRTCVYLERQKPGSRIGFSLELEAKVNRIDALLQALGRRVEDHIANEHSLPGQSNPAISQSIGGSTSQPSPRFDGVRAHGANTNVLSPAGQLGHTPSSQGAGAPGLQDGYWQPPSVEGAQERLPTRPAATGNEPENEQTPGGIKLSANDSFGHPNPLGLTGSQKLQQQTLTSGTDLPPHDIVYTLVDLYFKHCNTWCPILDRKTIFGTFFGSTSLNEADRVLLHAIVATTLRFSKDPRLSPEMKSHYHAVSKHTVQLYAMENVNIEALRALVILSLDELGTSNGPRAWNMLALIAQNTRQLDLCEESSVFLTPDADEERPQTGSLRRLANTLPESWIEDEGRRRLCWMAYLLDRYATISTTTFDFMLDDRKIKRCLPCSYDLFSRNVPVETRAWNWDNPSAPGYTIDKPENLGSFSYHCEILRILSRIHDFLKAPVDITSSSEMSVWRNNYRALDHALDTWLQSLPSEYSKISALCHSDPASRVANWFMLHSAFVTSVVRLHSSAAYPTVRSTLFVPSHYAMQRCLSAVQSLGDIAQDVLDANGLDLLGPPFAFSLWVAARLLLVHAATVECPVDPRIDFFIETLQHVGRYWEVAENYARILMRAVHRSRQGEMSLTAMRKSAQDLAMLTSTTRKSGTEPTSSQATSLNELDHLDIFDFFNYPKLAAPCMTMDSSSQTNLGPGQSTHMVHHNGMPDPESDWLGFASPFP